MASPSPSPFQTALTHPPSLAVIGDVCLDEYLSGQVTRFAPDRPIPVIKTTGRTLHPGGAANVAANIAHLTTGTVSLFSAVGDDTAGQALLNLLSSSSSSSQPNLTGKITTHIRLVPGRQTPHKTRVVAQGEHYLLRIDSESTEDLPEASGEAIVGDLRSYLANGTGMGTRGEGEGVQGIVCSDYAKGTLSPNVLRGVMQAGREWGVPVLVDAKPQLQGCQGGDVNRYKGASVVKVNLAELYALAQRQPGMVMGDVGNGNRSEIEEMRLRAAARDVLMATGAEVVIVTMGEDGARVVQWSGHEQEQDGEESNVMDVSCHKVEAYKPRQPSGSAGGVMATDANGAGDTFLAAFALAFCSGAAPAEAARFGSTAAGIAVTKSRTAVVKRVEMERAILALAEEETTHNSSRGAAGAGVKIVALDILCQAFLPPPRSVGAKVVFTNGCFDLLHAGHIKSLEGAKQLGDVLVVGLNSDESVTRLKGPGRPVVGEDQRALCLAALGCVDFVVVFGEDTPLKLIQEIRPDVLVKGADYGKSNVVGAGLVESYGGRVELLPLVKGVSTTETLDRIMNRVIHDHSG
ncbi:hypothetical protein N656DRAFT_785483 [Canariomyces notabilis]|uniref:D-glycero-beta-D-manno-heptose 1-phosphate adenylyltransferase n=1 Tax=Canariomyces notabilis TaxID=2074819 RepID=A0AAN6QCX2_9PEZI|nr:hypothetical protein N656DRAFT_785483 [Canariomyces arenarius]